MPTPLKPKTIKINPKVFKDIKFKIQVSPFGDKKCCCGFTNCVDLDCFYEEHARTHPIISPNEEESPH